jgi:hypothetical protein
VLEHGDAWLPRGTTPDEVEALAPRIAELRSRAGDADREDITVTLFAGDVDKLVMQAAERAGIHRVLFLLPDGGTDVVLPYLDQYVAALR